MLGHDPFGWNHLFHLFSLVDSPEFRRRKLDRQLQALYSQSRADWLDAQAIKQKRAERKMVQKARAARRG